MSEKIVVFIMKVSKNHCFTDYFKGFYKVTRFPRSFLSRSDNLIVTLAGHVKNLTILLPFVKINFHGTQEQYNGTHCVPRHNTGIYFNFFQMFRWRSGGITWFSFSILCAIVILYETGFFPRFITFRLV